MKYTFKRLIGILALPVMSLLMWGCGETAKQDVAPIVSNANNPSVTITPAGNYATVKEGDTLIYTLTVDKMFNQDIDFAVEVDGGTTTASAGADYEVIGGTFSAYTLTTEVRIIIIADDFPEVSETLNFTLTADSDYGYNFQLAPTSDDLTESITIQNVNDPTALTVIFEWADDSDFDLLVQAQNQGSFSTAGGTGSNPEVDKSVALTADDDSYFFGVDPYDVNEGDIAFTVYAAYPDGSFDEFSGTWNSANTDNYVTTDYFEEWDVTIYRMLTVVKSGESFTVTYNDVY